MSAIGPLALALVWRADEIIGPPPPGFESFKLLFAAMGALIGAQTLVLWTADVWGMPAGRYHLTHGGLIVGFVIVRWADADAVTLTPVPGSDDGAELLEVVRPGAFIARTIRLRVDPAAAPTLKAILADAGALPAGAPAPTGDVPPDATG